jgi:transcription elongation GreA/GreB family factor
MPKEPADPAIAEQEAKFLTALEARPIPVASLLEEIRGLQAAGQGAAASNYIQLLEDALVESGDRTGLLHLLRFRANGQETDRAFGLFCRELLSETWKDREAAAFLTAAGFGEQAPAEALRRLELLLSCQPGGMFLDKTWGFGVVRRVDAFYKKITVDFRGRPGHQLTFAHVADALQPVAPTHLLARLHTEPDAVARLVAEQPDEVVRLALQSFGALSVVRLEQLLVEHRIIGAADWKGFWERARKGLKSDPLVEIPARRTEPIVLHAQARDYGQGWVETFARERDPARILAGIEDFCEAARGGVPDERARAVLTDRLAFAIKGVRQADPALYARLAALAERTHIEAVPAAEMRAHLWEGNRFLKAAAHLVARDTERLVQVLLGEPDAAARLLAVLEAMPYTMLDATLAALREGPALPAAQARCRELLLTPKAPAAVVVWVFRHRDTLQDWPLPGLPELLAHAILLVEAPLTGEELRMQNQMRQLFENAKWFQAIQEELDQPGRRALFDRLQASTAWDAVTQRSLLGRMIKFDPALAERRRASDTSGARPPPERVTSWHSLIERRLLYKKLVEVELPKTSQDIAVARSYGDLRENFEYHAAKHAQSLLLQRQSEMEQEMKLVRGTDFANASTAAVGPGVSVRLAYPDGRARRYCILGEWDRDETLGIISCKSRMAQCLEGRKPGDTVQVPGEQGDEPVSVVAIEPLDETIRAWIGPPPASS